MLTGDTSDVVAGTASRDDASRATCSSGRYLPVNAAAWPGQQPSMAGRQPLAVPQPRRRRFVCAPQQSSSGKTLWARPLTPPKFVARFGERARAGVVAADDAGVPVPSEVRVRAVQNAPAHQRHLPSWLAAASSAGAGNHNVSGKAAADTVSDWHPVGEALLACGMWCDDPELDLDSLGDWVPSWAVRMTCQQLADLQAAAVWRALRARRNAQSHAQATNGAQKQDSASNAVVNERPADSAVVTLFKVRIATAFGSGNRRCSAHMHLAAMDGWWLRAARPDGASSFGGPGRCVASHDAYGQSRLRGGKGSLEQRASCQPVTGSVCPHVPYTYAYIGPSAEARHALRTRSMER
eukprot:365048-Chlamydomonas_euryale.AAC.12